MLLRNALYLKELRVGVPVGVRLKGMSSEMHSSKLPMPASDWKKDRELKISEDCSEHSEKSIIKGNSIESVEIEEIRGNPDKLDSMTVKELRTMTRSVGLSTSGNKQELISSLKFLLFKGKTTISEDVSDNKQKQTKKRKQMVESSIAEDDSKCVPEYNELSINTEEAIGAKQSSLQKQISSRVQRSLKVSTQISIAVDSNEPWTMLAHKKPQKEWIPYNPRTMRPPSLDEDTNSIKLISWNVNGLRALLKLKSFPALQLAQHENFDVLCLQETKLQEKDVDLITKNLIDGYDNSYWTCSVSKLGYSGTAIVSKKKPISVNYGLGIMDHDTEGRILTVEFDTFYLISGYVPNSGDGLRRLAYRVEQWDPSLSNYMKELEKVKPVILAGDLNCAHEEIDIYDPAGNRRSAGFTNEERESFQKNFLSKGFVDTFRRQHPSVVAYTYWGYRHGGRKTNKGWRLDYFLVSEKIADKVHDSYILPHVGGSDHCPIGLILKL